VRLPIAAALIALALTPHASAKILNAEDVLPPGQSGFVSLTGVTEGTGSPHLNDQTGLFTSFNYKQHTFDQPGTKTEPKAGVTITRDAYGVPNIRAGSLEDAWWGVGYAVSEDRLFQLELFRRATTGRLAEILGSTYLDDDLIARRDYYTRPEIEAQMAKWTPNLKARAQAYREGVNAYIAYLRSHPEDVPGEFTALNVPLREFEAWEQGAIGVFLARTVPSGDGNELSNLKLLRGAGLKGLDALLPIRQARETYTIPPSEAKFPSQPGRKRRHETAAVKRTIDASKDWDLPSAPALAGARSSVAVGLPGRVGGSYMFAVREPGNRAVLFNGPQLGYSIPELFVEFEIHHPGFDARGVSAAGIPLVAIGHNADVAWGFTSGLHDEDDLYAEKLAGPEKYVFKGSEKPMECRDEVFKFQSPPTDLTGGKPPESGSKTERICRTLHGPVQVRATKTAYARKYTIWGRELETLVGLTALSEAKTVQDVDRAMNEVTWNENVMAADSQGNIGYWHPGLHQLRPWRYDERLPYPGTGEAEWRGLRDQKATPRVINPKQGWLANWNNLPAQGWTSGDSEATERLSGAFHRGQFLQRTVRAFAKKPSYAGAKVLISHVGTTAQQRPLAEVRLRKASGASTGRAKEVIEAVRRWDGSYNRVDGQNTVDPGVAIWEELKDQLELVALKKLSSDLDAMKDVAGNPGKSHEFDISNGEAYALRTLAYKEWQAAGEATFAALEKKFGSAEIARWREPRRMYEVGAQGAAASPKLPFYDRGTWEQFVEVGP